MIALDVHDGATLGVPRRTIPTYCALCISRCGCLATVQDGRLIGVEPDPDHPTGRAICIKARAAPELVHHPDRLTTPLVRTRPKGDINPGFRPLSWDDALAMASERLTAHGPAATAFAVTTPSGTAIADSFGWIHRLVHAFGSPNLVFATENCNWHKDFAPALTWGSGIGMPDFAQTRCMLLWGVNPANTWLAMAVEIHAAQRRGAKLIVVDPRRTGLARAADVWLSPRPGTDAAVALGLVHQLLEHGGTDTEFLSRYSNAYDPAPDGSGTVLDRLAERAARFPASEVERLTGVRENDLRRAADIIAGERPVSFFTWTGTCQQESATDATRAVNILYALTGCLGSPGGNVTFAKPGVADIAGWDWVDADTRAKTLGMANRPLGPPAHGWITTRDLFRAVVQHDPYPIRALFAFGGNFLLTKPVTAHAEEALASLDFFAQTELFVTPTARFADLLLPAASCWEREGLQAGFAVTQAADAHLQLRPPVAAPPGAARSDTWIVFQLAVRLGLADRFFGGDIDAAMAHLLAPTGVSIETLRANPRGVDLPLATSLRQGEQSRFRTPSGRIEIWSHALAERGRDPLPNYVARPPDPLHPFLLTCGKVVAYCHSQQRNQPSLRKRSPRPECELAPDVAAARNIAAGTWVDIRTTSGGFRAVASVNMQLPAGTIWAQYGWWSDEASWSYNSSTDGEAFDPVSGSNAFHGVACDVQAVEAGPAA
ncbi:MAG: Acetylene hydratase [Gemmatimonadaceae bacterium]|nr:Acetylene hydratase [Gemmatimonadaceae bacterium]